MSNVQPTPRRDLIWTRGLIQCGILIVIVLLALGIAIAGVTRIREEAAHAQSANNLRQIGLATHNINDSFMEVPLVSGPWRGWPEVKQGWSLFASLLPYVQPESQCKGAIPGRLQWLVKTYVSPADFTGNGTKGECSYAANWQFFQQPFSDPQTYASIPRSMPDGTTNTILYSEIYQNCNGTVRRWGQTGGAAVLTTTAFNRMDPPNPKVLNPANGLPQFAPRHDACSPSLAQTPYPRGIWVVLGDASVRSINTDVSITTWQGASAPANEEPSSPIRGW